jgi:PleD family two-component response regulator
MVLLPECRAEEVGHVIGRVEGLEVDYNGTVIPCRFSRGWTDFKPGETPEELVKRADEALYSNKRAGKQNALAQSKHIPQSVV